ncbi:hypothetical protein PR048_014069 [Dryococelus australis]|uniref:Uncharacterized protein n=1 Tax=Dryococelus australis TaxID=614101 RepID=A0ABQ9HTZ1_9NEOP|nr:hypothetical protein PR048_014069 [Dryococelus australis]
MAMASDDFAHMEKLRGFSNFSTWKFQIVVLLKSEDFYDVVNIDTNDGAKCDEDWEKEDAKAHKYIITMINRGNIQYCLLQLCKGNVQQVLVAANLLLTVKLTVTAGLSKIQNLYVKLKNVGILTLTILTARLLVEEGRCHSSHIARNCTQKQVGYKICKKDNHSEQNCFFRNKNKRAAINRNKVAFLTETNGENPEINQMTFMPLKAMSLRLSQNGICMCTKLAVTWEVNMLPVSSLIGGCRGKGINMDCAPAATPQLNRQAERLNSMLMGKNRALHFKAGREKELWGVALLTATFFTEQNPICCRTQLLQNCRTTKAQLCLI